MNTAYLISFERELIKSEVHRTRLLLGAFMVALVIVIINYFLLDVDVASFYGGFEAYGIGVLLLIALIVYEYFSLLWLQKAMRSKRRLNIFASLLHAFIEVSFPTGIMLYMVHVEHMPAIIDSPVAMLYFLFITLSVLHLDFRISLMTGIVAAVQFGFLIVYALRIQTDFELSHINLPLNVYYLRSVFFLICGAAAGFVAEELKRRVRSTFELASAKSEIEKLFGQQVSHEVVSALLNDQGSITRQEASVLALDIRDFSSFAEKHSPQEVMEYQNQIFGPILDIINQHQGIVNQILGDGIMATFGTPIENPLHAEMAFQSALEILKKVKEMSANGEIPYTKIGIGLHSGEVTTGNIGNERRKQFSISGTAVILAFRLEQLTKETGDDLLLTEAFVSRITPGKVLLESLGKKLLKGFEREIEIFRASYKKGG